MYFFITRDTVNMDSRQQLVDFEMWQCTIIYPEKQTSKQTKNTVNVLSYSFKIF